MNTKNNTSNDNVPESISENEKFRAEQMELEIKRCKLDIEIKESDIKHKQIQNLCDKIEQARRNVEVLSKTEHLIKEELIDKKVVIEVLKINIQVLSEVVNIK